ncbi:uncharacterized protein LOC134821473 [Bolinopsis microptera]|uniref:uncharacterized protein LOC134821473 n=1 Tax=Bolinopsis microptera TaxID=2820187 RepID=UPI00307A461F
MVTRSLQVQVYSLAFFTYFGFYVSREPYSLVKMTLLKTWAPFNGPDGWLLLGLLDTAGLATYAIGIFIVGYLCEKFNCKHVLIIGCFAAGITTIFYGMANYWNVHNYWYFLVFRMLNGFAEAFGYPTLIKMLDHYFCHEVARDFIMTAFGSCKFLGIIIGCVISSLSVSFSDKWGTCFILCGLVLIAIGVLDMFLLPSLPPNSAPLVDETTPILANKDQKDVSSTNEAENVKEPQDGTAPIIQTDGQTSETRQQENLGNKETLLEALRLPGIIEYAIHLFFVKLSVYVLYYWIPTWFESLTLQGVQISYVLSCWFTAVWGLGGCVGTLLIGLAVYLTELYGVFSTAFAALASVFILSLYWYSTLSTASLVIFLVILLCVGITQNGPYSLASACMPSAINRMQTGRNEKLVGMATGIIDGFGSVGAIFGPLSGAIILQWTTYGWGLVFLLVAVSMFVAASVLSRQVYLESKRCRAELEEVNSEEI